jgi:PTS system galactitol-specific IIA component
VCIGVLKSPVGFAQMGTDGSIRLDVHIVFLLAIKETEKQVEMIQQLMKLIQSPSLVEGLSRAVDSSAALTLIRNTLA